VLCPQSSVSGSSRVREADRPSRAALERAVHRACVEDEIETRPRIPGEEFGRQQITFETVAPGTGRDDVAGNVRATVRQRMHVIQGRDLEVQSRRAIDAATTAVAHGRALDGALLAAGSHGFGPTRDARDSGEGNAGKVPTSGQ